MRGLTVAVTTLAVMAFTGPVQAQVSGRIELLFEAITQETARRERDQPAGQGHVYSHGEVGALSAGEERSSALIGDRGGAVTVVGFCDEACRDLDVSVVNQHGMVVAAEYAVDPRPVVTFAALPGYSYTLKVRMSGCAQNPCYYGASSYLAAR